MQEIHISEFISNQEVQNAVSKGLKISKSLEDQKKEEDQKEKYQKPVPQHLQIFHQPEDINEYITQIYPNMRIWISFKIEEKYNVDEVINNYIVYILGNDKKGVIRWKKYDPIRFPNQPYHKWFLRQLYFFMLNYRTAQYRNSFNTSLSENSYEESVENHGVHTINIDMLSKEDKSQDQSLEVVVKEFEERLFKFSKVYPEESFLCFEAYAYRLYQYKQEGVSNKEIAASFGISPSAVSQWMKKLKGMVRGFLDGELLPEFS